MDTEKTPDTEAIEKEIQRLEHRIDRQRVKRRQEEKELHRLRRQLSLARGDTRLLERDIDRVLASLRETEEKEKDFVNRIRKLRGEEVEEETPAPAEESAEESTQEEMKNG